MGRKGMMGAGRFIHGWHGPQKTRLRLARPGEIADAERLADLGGGPLDGEMAAAIADGTASSALLGALRDGRDHPSVESVARVAAAGDPTPLLELAVALIAERHERVVGALYALPPGAFIAQLILQGVPPHQAIITAMAVIKIKALAVEPEHRGAGIASELLSGCMRLYDQLGYILLYGSFRPGTGLESYYPARGFEIVPPGQGIPVSVILGRPAGLMPEGGEQFFARWRGHPSAP
jgi:GNAT superfamily N-acetyltransferase